MDAEEWIAQALATWRRHNEILLYLLESTPEGGLEARPAGSRGRDVARQFAHLHRVRLGWLHYHATGEKARLPRYHKGPPPSREELHEWLADSGARVENWLGKALRGEVRPRLFGHQPLRWMAYLIAHESHHRGQIVLALKQSGMRLPEKVAVRGLWGKWVYGK
ncbi:MAG: DinB family protein [Gemmatimonadota bacterium]